VISLPEPIEPWDVFFWSSSCCFSVSIFSLHTVVSLTSSIFAMKKILVETPRATTMYDMRLISRVGTDITEKIISAIANTVKLDTKVNVFRRLLRRSCM
jgi:hypothetical protein